MLQGLAASTWHTTVTSRSVTTASLSPLLVGQEPFLWKRPYSNSSIIRHRADPSHIRTEANSKDNALQHTYTAIFLVQDTAAVLGVSRPARPLAQSNEWLTACPLRLKFTLVLFVCASTSPFRFHSNTTLKTVPDATMMSSRLFPRRRAEYLEHVLSRFSLADMATPERQHIYPAQVWLHGLY